MIKHKKCGELVEEGGIALTHPFWCPVCEEDLVGNECTFFTIEGYKGFQDIVSVVKKEGFSIHKNSDNLYVGLWKGEKSSVEFKEQEYCFVYCYDFIKNGYKCL